MYYIIIFGGMGSLSQCLFCLFRGIDEGLWIWENILKKQIILEHSHIGDWNTTAIGENFYKNEYHKAIFKWYVQPLLTPYLKDCSSISWGGLTKMLTFAYKGGGTHWALEHWYVTLQPKTVISDPNGLKILKFDSKSDHSNSKNV